MLNLDTNPEDQKWKQKFKIKNSDLSDHSDDRMVYTVHIYPSNPQRKHPALKPFLNFFQGCGSGSGLDPDSIGSVDPDPGGQKCPTKVETNLKVHVLKCWMASFES